MTHDQRVRWLRCEDPTELESLWARADAVRREQVGDEVHLRGLIEISNRCARRCAYCGIRAGAEVERYTMPVADVLACAAQAAEFGYGTVVVQAGEGPAVRREYVRAIIDGIRTTPETAELAITLSLGERTPDELSEWKAAGADRYLLRFETSDPTLFDRIHPDRSDGGAGRFAALATLRALGYEVGSGVMVGIPGQTWEMLAADVERFAALDLDMIGLGPYLPDPDTPLGRDPRPAGAEQAPNDELTTYKTLALARLVCPRTNIPSTTALATVNKTSGRERGLQRGANVVMPNLTPPAYRSKYTIYPSKACLSETAAHCRGCMRRRIESIGRTVGTGRGDSPNLQRAR